MYSVLCWKIETGPIERFYKSSMKVSFLTRSVAAVNPLVFRFLREGRGCCSPCITQCVIFPAFI